MQCTQLTKPQYYSLLKSNELQREYENIPIFILFILGKQVGG